MDLHQVSHVGDLCLHLLLQVHEQEAASKTTIPYGVTASHPLLPYDDVHLSCLTWVTLLSSLYVAVFISLSLQGRSALLQASLAAPAYCTQRRSPVAAKFVWWAFELTKHWVGQLLPQALFRPLS